MAIPLSYNLRNLTARKTMTLMTALGIALTVAVLLSVMALVQGLRTSLTASGHPAQLLVMRKGATAELNSVVSPSTFQELKSKQGIARNAEGEPLASLELVTVIVLENEANPQGINITVRGLTPLGFSMREGLRITEGRMFETGKRELVVGRGLAARYPDARLGGKIEFGRGEWTVVGVMDGGRSAANSEMFADLYQIASDQGRPEAMSSVLVRASDEVAMRALVNDLESDPRFNIDAVPEKEYFEQQTSSAAPIQYVGMFVAIIMAVGSSFAAMNTMYAAVARRSAEIGTLRVLGFSKAGILTSFLIESVLISLLGGILGCVLVLPIHNLQTGVGSFVTFSEITFEFQVTPAIMGIGILFALAMGVAGGLFPAGSAARKEILTALRQN
ncbi:MAG: ABC transporter permease [Bryobacteraceae bacterium]